MRKDVRFLTKVRWCPDMGDCGQGAEHFSVKSDMLGKDKNFQVSNNEI
jgi:hypothetical protein